MRKNRILVIDDERNFTRLLKLNLEKTGAYEVREENRGAQGLAAAREFRPDLILLDIMMPDMSGDEVAEQIREHKELKEIPIVFLTAIASKAEVSAQGGLIGGEEFLAKPASPEEVIARIERRLGKTIRSAELAEPSPLGAPEKPEEHRSLPGKIPSARLGRLAVPLLAILAAGGALLSYKLYSRSQQLLRETSNELQRTQIQLSFLRASASEAILRRQEPTEERSRKPTAKEQSADQAGIEALVQKTLEKIQASRVSNLTRDRRSGSLLTKLAPSVVRLSCLADSFSGQITSGTGVLYRASENNPSFPRYYVQTSLHVVRTTDGSRSQCTIVLYPDPARSDSYLLFKSQGYRFYRESIDLAFLEPEIVRGHARAGTLDQLALHSQEEETSPVCASLHIGDQISVLGYPDIGGETLTVTDGIISGFEFYQGARYLKSSAKMDRGNSGGIAVKDSGCLIGIPTFVRQSRVDSLGRILDLNYLFNVTLR